LLGSLPYLLPLSEGLCLLNGETTRCKKECTACLIAADVHYLEQFGCSILPKCTHRRSWWHFPHGASSAAASMSFLPASRQLWEEARDEKVESPEYKQCISVALASY